MPRLSAHPKHVRERMVETLQKDAVPTLFAVMRRNVRVVMACAEDENVCVSHAAGERLQQRAATRALLTKLTQLVHLARPRQQVVAHEVEAHGVFAGGGREVLEHRRAASTVVA
eukprot:scaffold84256_cov66-Phaeocystis_antarctica.AAC.5